MFNQESSQAIFFIGNVQLIGLKTSRIQCPSCLHYVFKGTILCAFGKHIRPHQEMTRRIKAAFEKFKAPHFRASFVDSRCETRPSLVAGAPPQGDLPYSAAFTSTYEVSTNIQASGTLHNTQRPRYQEAKIALVDMEKQSRQDLGKPFIPIRERKRLHNQIDPSLQGYFEWLSTHWAEYFGEEREPPTSSSSSHWSYTSWWSPQSWTSNWQGWHQHSWNGDKWSEYC